MGYNLFASWRCRSYILQCFISFTYLYVIFAKCLHLCCLRLPLLLWSRKVGNNCLLFFLSPPEIHTWVPRNVCPSLSSSFFLIISSQFQLKSILRQNSFFVIEIRWVINLERGYWLEGDMREFPGMLERFCTFWLYGCIWM